VRQILAGAIVTALTAALAPCVLSALQTQNIEALTQQIQGKQPDQVRALIVARLGPPARDIGSGVRIEQWDVDGGVLTFHPMTGVDFERGGVWARLIRTTNPVESCLFGSYEMKTVAEAPHGMHYWLGEVVISPALQYLYTDSGSNRDHRAAQGDNFFILHPMGSIRVEYGASVGSQTRLEDLRDGTLVATVTFLAKDDQSAKQYRIVAHTNSMRLEFDADGASHFEMGRPWVSYWR
jgi:hypothetical protein